MNVEDTNLYDFSHNIFKNDPILFKSYVNKTVSVTTTDNNNPYTGIVYTIDPVSESVVLLQPEGDNEYSLKVILGCTVQNIEVKQETEIVIPELFLPAASKISESALAKKKNAVKQLLLDNRFPVKEANNVLIIENMLLIEPPYSLEQCICSNSTILSRIQNLLSQLKS